MKIQKTVLAAMVVGFGLLSCSEINGPDLDIPDEIEYRGSEAYPWKNHAAPYDFLFGNGMDDHFQGKVSTGGRLNGFLYITYTGDKTSDGYLKAIPGSCSLSPGGCTVGWIVKGIPVRATLLGMTNGGGSDGGHDDGGHDDGGHDDGGHDDGGGHDGGSGGGHDGGSGGGHDGGSHGGGEPVWCIDPGDLPVPPGYKFFHWIGELQRGKPQVGKVYDGFLMKLTAREKFYLDKRGGWYIDPGIDFYSHDNVVTDCE